MKTYRCDKCGHELALQGIVGKEFDYMKVGFETLNPAFQFNLPDKSHKVIDVCKPCFREICRAADQAKDDAKDFKRRSFLDRVAAIAKATGEKS